MKIDITDAKELLRLLDNKSAINTIKLINKEKDLQNPLYDRFNRLGCWCCPEQNLKSLKSLYNYYPELWGKLKKYEKDSPHGFRLDYTLQQLETRFAFTNEFKQIVQKYDFEDSEKLKRAVLKDCKKEM